MTPAISFAGVLLAVWALFGAQPGSAAVPTDYVAAAIAAADRPPEQVARDAERQPEDLLTFAGVKLMVIDHVAEAGSGTRATETLHRIDPEVIVRTALAAGFRLEAESDLLRNPQDSHRLRVFDAAVRGRTDQVILKFRKPASASAAPAATARAPAVAEASGRGSGCAGLCL